MNGLSKLKSFLKLHMGVSNFLWEKSRQFTKKCVGTGQSHTIWPTRSNAWNFLFTTHRWNFNAWL